MSYPAYTNYKPSNRLGLDVIPAHWETTKVKHVATCLDGKRIPLNGEQRSTVQGEYPYWGANGIVDHIDKWLFDEELVLLGEDGAPFFESNKDVAFSVCGKLWVNNHAHVLRPNGVLDRRYLTYALNSVDYSLYIKGSTRDKLNQSDMGCISLWCPAPEEQSAIANFLDRETAKIDTLIEKQERLIKLLEEKRQAVISHAVTKGLNPDVRMKDSGVEWLGEVPEHWEVRRLATYGHFVAGCGFPHEFQGQESGAYPFFKVSDTNIAGNEEYLIASNNYVSKEVAKVLGAKIAPRGGIMFPKVGAALLGNKRRILVADSITDNNTMVFVPFEGESRYWYYWLREVDLGQISNPGPVPSVNEGQMRDFAAVCPPQSERKAIVKHLDSVLQASSAVIAQAETAVTLLRERRTALISAAVTGKIDVRNAA